MGTTREALGRSPVGGNVTLAGGVTINRKKGHSQVSEVSINRRILAMAGIDHRKCVADICW